MKKDKEIKLYEEPTIKVVLFHVEVGSQMSGDGPTMGEDDPIGGDPDPDPDPVRTSSGISNRSNDILSTTNYF